MVYCIVYHAIFRLFFSLIVVQGRFCQRLPSEDESRLRAMQQSPDAFSAPASLNSSETFVSPVRKLLASHRVPAHLSDVVKPQLSLGNYSWI